MRALIALLPLALFACDDPDLYDDIDEDLGGEVPCSVEFGHDAGGTPAENLDAIVAVCLDHAESEAHCDPGTILTTEAAFCYAYDATTLDPPWEGQLRFDHEIDRIVWAFHRRIDLDTDDPATEHLRLDGQGGGVLLHMERHDSSNDPDNQHSC